MKKRSIALLFGLFSFTLLGHAEVPRHPDTEASFILPLIGSNGEDLYEVHQQVRENLAAWGQFVIMPVKYAHTLADGTVGTVDSIEYTVVVHCDPAGQKQFRDVARNAKEAAHLESLYFKQCSSHVMLLK